VPGAAGSALDGVSIDDLTLVIVPPKGAGLKPDDAAMPAHIAANLKKVLADAAKHDASKSAHTLGAGFNLLAELDIKGSKGLGSLMASGGLTETVIPIVGTISASTFSKTASKADKLKGLSLDVALPDLKVPGLPSTIKITKPVFAVTEAAPAALKQPAGAAALAGPFVTIGADLVMQAGGGTHEFDSLLMVGKDAKGKQVINFEGSAKDPKGLFTFKGLSVKTLDLASVYEAGAWDFRFDGKAALNGKELDFDTEIKKEAGKVTYVATLSGGGAKGISAKDVVGRDVPGFDDVALTKVVVSKGRLVADLAFGAKKVPGEIAAFHPGTLDKAVLAMTLDKLAFGDLVPGAVGSALDGVSIDDLTLIIVPPKGAGLKPDDAAMPAHIAANLKKVLADAGKATGFALKQDINLFAELDLSKSDSMSDLMSFIGYDPKAGIPISGVMGRNMFSSKAKGGDRFKGMALDVPMPKINLSKLPGSFSFKNPELKITDVNPAGKEGLWVGLVADLNADLLGKNIAFKSEVGFSKGEISLAANSESELKSPFGISWLSLKELDLSLDYDKKTKSGELLFTAVPTKPFGKTTPKISIELKEVGGKLTAGVLKIQEKVAFSELPILKDIPHADQFDFTFLEISKSGVSGGTLLHGQEVDAVIFEQNSKWTFAVSDNGGGKGFKFGRIMPVLKKTPLADFHLNDAALIFSQADISEKVSALPEVAQTVFTEIYGSANASVKIKNGITIAANFSPGSSSGFAAKGLKGIGIHDDVLIEGTVENIFGGKGAPGVDILVQVEQGPGGSKGASHTPKMAKFPGQIGFFIQYKADELDVGLAADVTLHLPKKQKLDLTTKLELEINEKGFGVDIFMDLEGKWDKPFGIKGVDLEEVAIKFGIDMLGEAKFGFAGKIELADGAERIDIAAEMDFELDAGGLPDGVAMRGSISELGIPAMIDIVERMAGVKGKMVAPNDIPLPEFKDVVFAFATPGASDPQLGLVGSGFKLAGELYFMGHELGKADISAGPSGIKMDASVDPIDLKVLKLKENQMKFDLSFKALPKLEIDSKIEFLGAEEDVTVKFANGMVNMGLEIKIGGGIWDSTIDLGFGFDPKHKGAPDIFIEGEVKSDFFGWLKDKAPAKVHHFFNQLNAAFDKAKKKINDAEKVVRSWSGKIQARKAAIQRQKANADAAIHRAESRVRSVKKTADHAHDNAEHHKHRCKWYRAWECAEEAYWWGVYGVDYAAYEVAEGVLHAAQAVIDHLPAELMDPQLDFLEAKQGIAMAALEIAKLAINGVEAADKWIDKGIEKLLKAIGSTKALVIKEIFFEADMDGMLKGQPAILSIDLEIFGDDLGMQMFAFKLTDPLFDAEQLAFIPLHMVSQLFKKILPKSLKKLLGPVLTSIDNESKKAEKKVYDELKSIPGLNLPPEIKKALEEASIEWNADGLRSFAAIENDLDPYPYLKRSPLSRPSIQNEILVAANTDIMTDSGENLLMLAQAAPGSQALPVKKAAVKKVDRKSQTHADRFAAFKDKRRNLLAHTVERNKAFGESVVAYQKEQKAERAKNENDMFVAYTDVHVPPGELFTERLLVVRHSKLCLGQNGQGKITFHPCSENPGGLLWSTQRRLVNLSGHMVPWNPAFAQKFPNRVYAQLVHNGACLTTPFHLKAYDPKSKKTHRELLLRIAKSHPKNAAAHLKLAACRNDGRGQLWKTVKLTHDKDNKHGFKLQERDSGYCLRPNSVKAHTKKQSKEVNAVFYPCTGIAHGTFEMTVPNNDMPIWYDHNGVIKSDNGYCLDVPNDPAANADSRGSAVYLKKCANDEYDRWDYVVEYDKTVKIVNDFTGHCLYPYDKAEGKIPNAAHGQLVQRPCDGRYGQGWKMRVIPKQKWFQLEAMDSSKKATGMCMISDKANPGQTKVNVYVKSCSPATRGRWQFGHWK
ncbi:MAG: RICIN domain-containing protein, partial [Rhodospirillales bacterium]